MNAQHAKYVLKLIADLVKIDKKIHSDEIVWIRDFIRGHGLSPDVLQEVQELSFIDAITALQCLDADERRATIELVEHAASIDNEIDTNEQIILATIRLSLRESTRQRIQLISADTDRFDHYDRQFIYLEQSCHPHICDSIGHNYPLLRQLLGNSRIDFFFFPRFMEQCAASLPFDEDTTHLLFPSFTTPAMPWGANPDESYHTSDFCAFIHKQMGEKAPGFCFDAFFLLKVEDEDTGNHNKSLFLCLEASDSPVGDIHLFISNLLLVPPFNTIPYEGCYRSFFEMLGEHSKVDSQLLLADDSFFLPQLQNRKVEIQGAERKTLFSLFLLHADTGISHDAFAGMSSVHGLGHEAVILYKYFAGEKLCRKLDENMADGNEPDVIVNLRDIGKRNSHIGFIKKAFTRIAQLKNPERYFPVNLKGQYTYKINLAPDDILGQHFMTGDSPTKLTLAFFR